MPSSLAVNGMTNLAIGALASQGAQYTQETIAPKVRVAPIYTNQIVLDNEIRTLSPDYFLHGYEAPTAQPLQVVEPRLPTIPRASLILPMDDLLRSRLDQLKRIQAEEQLDYPGANIHNYSDDSEKSLFQFLRIIAARNIPMLTIKKTGNIRAIWEDEIGQQVGIQFLDDDRLQFVLIIARGRDKNLSTYYGTDTTDGFIGMLENTNLIEIM